MAEPDGLYILHTQKPRFLTKVESNTFEVIDDIDSMLEYYKGDSSKVEGLFKRLSDWYKSYKIYNNGNRQVYGKN